MTIPFTWFTLFTLCLFVSRVSAQPKNGDSPPNHLPPHIVQLTAFGERPDWAADGTKLLFLTKTFGDVRELDFGSSEYTRLTYFSDYPNYKCSNPVVSDDGHFIAFQMGMAGEAAGVGHGIFVYDLTKAPGTPAP